MAVLSYHMAFPQQQYGDLPSNNSFFPYRYFVLNDVLPHTWDASDMTVAWTAGSLHLDLLILKSVDDIFINDILQKLVTGPVESDVIDQFFILVLVKTG